MEKVPMNGHAETPKHEKKKTHLRLKVDLASWQLIPFKNELQFQPNIRVRGKEYGFLCFTLFLTHRF